MVDLVTYVTDPEVRPYLHPVMDPSGTAVMTDDRPADHVWHHGVFAGLHQVNGIDFWTEKKGEKFGSQHFVRLLDVSETVDRVSWRALSEWRDANGKVLIEEEQEVAVHAVDSPDLYRIDFDWTLRAKDQTVKVGKYDFSGFAVRMKTMPDHTHLNSNGEQNADAWNKAAKWCNVANPYGHREWYGMTILDHPSNFRFPNIFKIDAEGFINPSPSKKGDWEIEAGKPKTFKYRVIVHKGQGEAAVLEREWANFAAVTGAEVGK